MPPIKLENFPSSRSGFVFVFSTLVTFVDTGNDVFFFSYYCAVQLWFRASPANNPSISNFTTLEVQNQMKQPSPPNSPYRSRFTALSLSVSICLFLPLSPPIYLSFSPARNDSRHKITINQYYVRVVRIHMNIRITVYTYTYNI